MSYIMRALKRAEQEREAQRVIVPSDVPARAAPARRPSWPIVVAALLAANVVVLALMLWPESSSSNRPLRDRLVPGTDSSAPRRAAEPRDQTAAPERGPSPEPAARRSARGRDAEGRMAAAKAVSPAPAGESRARAISPTPRNTGTSKQSAPPVAATQAPTSAVRAAVTATPPTPAAAPVDHARDTARAVRSAPSPAELAGGQTPAAPGPKAAAATPPRTSLIVPPIPSAPGTPIPLGPASAQPPVPATKPHAAPSVPPAPPEVAQALKLEVLVYGESAAGRMVFINGRKYVEGQTVDGGFVIDRITEQGVVLSGQGRTFVLEPPRR